MDLFLILPAFVASLGAVITGSIGMYAHGVSSKKFNVDPELPAPEVGKMVGAGSYQVAIEAAPKPIPKEIKDEIEQNQDWFDSQMHATLLASGAKVIAREVTDIERVFDGAGELLAEFGGVERVAIAGCTCEECIDVLRHAPGYKKIERMPVAEVDIYEDNE